MNDIRLIGSDDVSSASYRMQSASNEMRSAADKIEDCTRRLEVLFGQGYGSNLDFLIEALNNKKTL